MLSIKEVNDGISLKIRVQPRAAKNQVTGLFEDALKVRLTSPPVDGAANQACIEFLAKLFGVAKSQVEITSGHTGRNKTLHIQGITREVALSKLHPYLS